MKTETTNPMTEVSNIINPCRILKVEEWKAISSVVTGLNIQNEFHYNDISLAALHYLERFEDLTSQPLTKEMFVNPIEKPVLKEVSVMDYDVDSDEGMTKWFAALGMDDIGIAEYNAYQAAQSKILFEGFRNGLSKMSITCGDFEIYFKKPEEIIISFNRYSVTISTVFDLIYQITKYNETAQSKINLFWSQNFIKELLK